MTVLEVQGLQAGYGQVQIVHGVDLGVAAGEILALLGPNGAGKSTLLKAIAGVAPVTGGRVVMLGQDVAGHDAAMIAAAGAAYVPQERNIFRTLNVAANLELGGWLVRGRLAERQAAVLDLLPELKKLMGRTAGRLSGGERQILAVGMALMVAPKVLLVDEPTAGLAPSLVGRLLDLLRRLAESGLAVLLVEQNARAALAKSDRALIMVDGKEVFSGSAVELLAAPDLGDLFLGRAA
jgi:ABC-type branched-subunit amino acid transport system ATPase component